MKLPRRSLLTGTAALAALASMRERAEAANVPFTTFAFDATGGTTPRTQPDRLADIRNVLDFGADPTGNSGTATATTAAIQAAVNSLSGAGRGTIFFPVGTYITNSAITFNFNGGFSIHFLGCDSLGSAIQGNFAGFLFDRHNVNSGSPLYSPGNIIFEKLSLLNVSTSASSGCIRMGSTIGGAVRDCTFSGNGTSFTTEDSAGHSSQGIVIENCKFSGADNLTVPQENLILGGSGVILNCDFSNCDTAIRAYGTGIFMAGNRAETSNNHYLLGTDSGGGAQATSGFVILGGSTEGCTTGLDMGGPGGGVCSGFLVAAGNFGHDKTNSGYPFGVTDSQYGTRVRAGSANNGVFQCGSSGFIGTAGISIGNASSRANLVFLNCAPVVATGGGSLGFCRPMRTRRRSRIARARGCRRYGHSRSFHRGATCLKEMSSALPIVRQPPGARQSLAAAPTMSLRAITARTGQWLHNDQSVHGICV